MATPKKSTKPAKSAKSEAKADAAAAKPAHVPPVVNLSLAAQSAALSMAARKQRAASAEAAAPSAAVNAAAFKELKSGISTPQHSATSLLAGLNKPTKPTGTPGYARPGGFQQQTGPNVARTGVPRRTGGG
ncbi:MAG TPA: hypothetical protein VF595_16485 [Tepidisphaeraceae bacterium]|jgi:hypothetical protein